MASFVIRLAAIASLNLKSDETPLKFTMIGFSMKIAFSLVKNTLRGGGIEKYTLELGSRLVQRGHDVTVFSMKHYGNVETKIAGMRVVSLPSIKHSSLEKISTGAMAALHLALSSEEFDIVHFHSIAAGAFGRMLKNRACKTVLQMHGIEWQRSRWNMLGTNMLKALEWISLKSHDAYTAVSQTQCSYYRNAMGLNMTYIPTGAEVFEPCNAHEILDLNIKPGNYVLFASRLVREKGAHYLIEAFRRVQTECKLVIAGDANGEEAYKNELRQLAGADPRIIFPGFVEGRKLKELFSNSALYVQPSEMEGLSIALLEAMSYGNCCLVSDIPENREAIADCGVSFQNANTKDLRVKLTELLNAPDIRHSLGQRARCRVKDHFSWDAIASNFEELYRNLLVSRPSVQRYSAMESGALISAHAGTKNP